MSKFKDILNDETFYENMCSEFTKKHKSIIQNTREQLLKLSPDQKLLEQYTSSKTELDYAAEEFFFNKGYNEGLVDKKKITKFLSAFVRLLNSVPL